MANALSIPIGKQKQTLSTREWRKIWLEKLKKASEARKLNKTTSMEFLDFANRFLSRHSCHPGEIDAQALVEFLERNKKSDEQARFCRDALVFFYSNVVPSEKHVEFIKQGFIPSFPTLPKPGASAGRPQGEIISKTPEIIKTPLKMPQKPAEEVFAERMKNNLKRLRDELHLRNYSQRTIKNYSAIDLSLFALAKKRAFGK